MNDIWKYLILCFQVVTPPGSSSHSTKLGLEALISRGYPGYDKTKFSVHYDNSQPAKKLKSDEAAT